MKLVPHVPRVKDYAPFVGKKWVEYIRHFAKPLKGKKMVHVNATAYGGGVAELLNSAALLMNDLGIECGWRVLVGSHSFFKATRKMFDGLQGKKVELTPTDKRLYKDYNERNSIINHLQYHDVVIVHDSQPLAMVNQYKQKKCAWIWRCHVDLSKPHQHTAQFLRPMINKYQSAIFHLPQYVMKGLKIPTHVMPPSIDPLSPKNIDMKEKDCYRLLHHHGIKTDKPFLLHVSRFDRWKNQWASIETFKKVKKHTPCRLVLIGDMATDDPDGPIMFSEIKEKVKDDKDIILLTEKNDFLVNALQRCAAVVLQPSIREGFGLVVAEALWKKTPVVATPVGGIPLQVINGKTGFLASNPDAAAKQCLKLIKSRSLNKKLAKAAHEHVRRNFLITRELEEYIKLIPRYCPIK